MADHEEISLADGIENLRTQLELALQARRVRSESSVELPLKEVVFETEVIAKKSTSGDGKVNYWIVSGGGSYATGHEARQKITLRFTTNILLGEQHKEPTA